MAGFEPGSSDIGSDRSANSATTTESDLSLHRRFVEGAGTFTKGFYLELTAVDRE